MPTALQDQHDVIRSTATGSCKKHFHRTGGEIAPAAIGSAIHGYRMAASRFRYEAHSFTGPPHGTLQDFVPPSHCCGDATVALRSSSAAVLAPKSLIIRFCYRI